MCIRNNTLLLCVHCCQRYNLLSGSTTSVSCTRSKGEIPTTRKTSLKVYVYRRLLALGLELPEDAFVNIHSFNENNNSYSKLRAHLYYDSPDVVLVRRSSAS